MVYLNSFSLHHQRHHPGVQPPPHNLRSIGVKNTIDDGNPVFLDNISSEVCCNRCGAVILVTVVKIIAALAKREGIPKTWLALAGR